MTTLFRMLLVSIFAISPLLAEEKKSPPTQTIVDITVAQTKQLLTTNQSVVVLDVRTPEEFAAGHITGATNLDFHSPDFDRYLAALDRKKPYLVHCAAGVRSGKTIKKMDNLNFRTIYHLEEGFRGWEKAGNKVEKKR